MATKSFLNYSSYPDIIDGSVRAQKSETFVLNTTVIKIGFLPAVFKKMCHLSQPLVSVIVVPRKRPEMVDQCLKLFCLQTYTPFEIIVVNGSSDNLTKLIVQDYPEISYIFHPTVKA